MNALHTLQDRFATVLETAVVGVLETDLDGVVVYSNSRACEMLGLKVEELLGQSVLRLTHASSIDDSKAAMASLQAGSAGHTFRKRYLRGDGTVLFAETTLNAIRDDAGAAVGIMAILIDRTEQAHAEQALRDRDALQAYLLRLADTLRPLADAGEIQAEAAAVVGEQLRASRILYAEVAGELDDTFIVRHDFRQPGVPPVVGKHRFDDFGRFIAQEFRKGKTLAIGDVREVPEIGPDELAIYDALSFAAFLAVPLVKEGRIVAYLAANHSEPREWSLHDIAVIEETAERTWAAVQRAYAEAALRKADQSKAFQLELSEAIRTMTSVDDMIDTTSRMLGERLRATRVVYCEVTGPDTVVFSHDWANAGRSSIASTATSLSQFGSGIIADLRAGRVVVNEDVYTDPRTSGRVDAFDALGMRSQLAVPVLRGGQLKLVLAIHRAEPSEWDTSEVELAQAVSQQILLAAEAATSEAKLRAERDLSQAIFDSMQEGFALIGPDWTIIEVNEIGARIAQRSRAQMVGHNHWDVLPESIGTPVDAVYRRVLATGVYETFEYLHEPDGGDATWVEIRAYRISTGALAVFYRDITDRKRIEEELGDAVRRRDEFLAMLAHELRNPLAPIRAAAHVLSMPGVDEMRLKQTTDIIARQVEHMTSLVDDLLDVSRVTRGLAVLDKQRVDLKWAASSAVEQVRPLIEARRHHLTIQLPPGNAEVSGDPKRLVQVFANLLNNAAKYTQEGGNILLRIDILDEHVAVNVEDNGRGMSPDMVRRAFTLFSQAEQTPDRTQGGLGIGLALVKSLVELHEGTVSASSPGEAKGSTFSVCLPRRLDETSAARRTDQVAPPRVSRPLRILVVDDNQDAASTLEMLLEASGHSVRAVQSPHVGLEQALANPPDVCLLDIGLPGMDGNELARRLRASHRTRDAVLIAVTGYGQDADREGTSAAGFDHHLVKPVDPYALERLLAGVRPRSA